MSKPLSKSFRLKTAVRILCALFVLISVMGTSAAPAFSMKAQNPVQQNPVITDTWAVQVLTGTDPDQLAGQLGAENLGQVGTLTDYYLFRIPGSNSKATAMADVFATNSQVVWFEQQVARQQSKRTPSDPLYTDQWHLNNNTTGEVDINVEQAWIAGFTGSGVTIAVVDDGLQYTHPDLSAQYVPAASWDFNDNDSDPMAASGDFHGTAAAGVAAANNDGISCGVGVAYDAGLAGLRLIGGDASVTDAQEATALTYAADTNSIYSNSWGPDDLGIELAGPGTLALAALRNGVTSGRGGKGSIYVWGAGNGLESLDDVNYDGYANSRYTIAVGAVNNLGVQASYSEPGAAMLVTAPSGSVGSLGITTTDLTGSSGYNNAVGTDGDCTDTFTGTSSAAPLVSGVVALMLQANPNLGWRDVQHILARTAVKNDPTDADWTTNGAVPSFDINHKYGFGLVDAGAAVAMASTWPNVSNVRSISSGIIPVGVSIPDNDPIDGVTSIFNVTQKIDLEHVEVVFNATHPFRGNLKIILTSPSGTKSILADTHGLPPPDPNAVNADYPSWKFMTVRDWGESSVGTWSLQVLDTTNLNMGTFDSWQLNLYGTAAPGAIVTGGDTTGVFRPSNGLLYLKNTNTSGFADVAINYGTGGDYPVTGDWDGNGTDTIGIYRNGSFYLRNSNTLGFADLVFAFGTPGDQPVAGDWDGDGVDTIGVYHGSTVTFSLRNSNSPGTPDVSFQLGLPGDIGIAGDWNGDGVDTTGVFRPSNGVIFMKNANTSGFADIAINYGIAGDQPVTGDWNDDGIDTIGVYRNAQFMLRNSNTLGFADIVFALGIPGDMPIAGNWDGIP